MGTVFLAWQDDLGRRVAVKLLREPRFRERLRREAQTAARLRHPGIVTIYEVGEDYIAMELIEGRTLDAADLPLRNALDALARVADAVQHAHEHGVVHRDLKPQNVMLRDDGSPCVMDFGLARVTDVPSSVSITGTIVGTPAFMAPEQVAGDPDAVGPRSDVYGLGATLFAIVTGRSPYAGSSILEILRAMAVEDPPSPRALRPDLPKPVEAIICKAMARDPDARYASAAEFAADLRRHLGGEAVQARLPKRRPSRAPLWIGLAVLAIATVVLVGRLLRKEPDAGEPFVAAFADSFDRAELGPRWITLRGDVVVHDGELCSRNGSMLFYLPVEGDVDVEFDARVMPDSSNCKEISLFLNGSKDRGLQDGYCLEFGLGDDPGNCVQRLRVVVKREADPDIVQGKRYRMRARRIGSTLTYEADGRELLAYEDPDPLPSSGHIGFSSQCAHLHVDNFRIRTRLTGARKLGDLAYEAGDFEISAAALAAFTEIQTTDNVVRRRLVDCFIRLGRLDEAEEHAVGMSKQPGALETDSIIAVRTLVDVLVLRNKWAEALETLRKAPGFLRQPDILAELESIRESVLQGMSSRLSEGQLVEYWGAYPDVLPPRYRDRLARLYWRRGDEEAWSRLAAGDTLLDTALLRWRQGKLDDARKLLDSRTDAETRAWRLVLAAAEGEPTQRFRDGLEGAPADLLLLADLLEGRTEPRALEGTVEPPEDRLREAMLAILAKDKARAETALQAYLENPFAGRAAPAARRLRERLR